MKNIIRYHLPLTILISSHFKNILIILKIKNIQNVKSLDQIYISL